MKKDEVPQDHNSALYQDKFGKGLVKYALDDKDHYTTALSSGWEPEMTVLQQALDELEQNIREIRQKVINRQLSPIAYYAEVKRMDLGVLASYAGMWKWRVKRHFKPAVFDRLPVTTLKKYADVFHLSVGELTNYNIK
ncbi:MAG TPA: hypothetical protein PK076_08500 [Saprospiraceae bacterium]|nr:hypothetical protein [Saprospiraceae bacterium]HQW56153.1 hypothetical protein [Saprospiraceae bacterium]